MFTGHLPLDATGASEMVKDISEEKGPGKKGKLIENLLNDFPCEIIYANGGSRLIKVYDSQKVVELVLC